jgi:hypothetical protein
MQDQPSGPGAEAASVHCHDEQWHALEHRSFRASPPRAVMVELSAQSAREHATRAPGQRPTAGPKAISRAQYLVSDCDPGVTRTRRLHRGVSANVGNCSGNLEPAT